MPSGVLTVAKQSDWGVEFVNIEVKHKPALYFEGGKVPSLPELIAWCEQCAPNFWRFGFGYNERTKSFTVSATDRGSMPVDQKPKTLTQHGKSFHSALVKLYVILEVCSVMTEGWAYGGGILQVMEERIDDAIEKLLTE